MEIRNLFRGYQQAPFDAWSDFEFVGKGRHEDVFSHIHRDFNTIADEYATSGVLGFGKIHLGPWRWGRDPQFVRVWFDGGCRDQVMGAGVCMEAADDLDVCGRPKWIEVAGFGTRLRRGSSGENRRNDSVIAEAVGCGLSICLLCEFLSRRQFVFTPYCNVGWRNDRAKSVW